MQSTKATRHDAHSLLAAAAAALLGFALNFIVARAIGPSGKGILDLCGASAGLFSLVLGFSLNAGLTRSIAASGQAPSGLARAIWLWSVFAGLVIGAALLLMPEPARRAGLLPLQSSGFWTLFIATSAALGIAAAALRGIVIGRGGLVGANRIDLIIKGLLLAAYIAAALLFAAPSARMFAVLALPVLAILPVLLHLTQRGPIRPEPGAFRAIVLTTLPLHGANILHFLNQRADLFFVQAFHGPAEVGIYALAVSLAQTVLFLSSALAVPLLPKIAATTDTHLAAMTAVHACRRFVLLGGSAALMLGATSTWLVPAVFGRDFSQSLTPLLLLLPGMIAFGLTNLLVSYFAGTGENRVNLGISVLGLALTVTGNLTLTRLLGANGAAAVSTLAYGGMAFASLWIFARRSGLPLFHAVVPDKETLRSSALMLAHLRP